MIRRMAMSLALFAGLAFAAHAQSPALFSFEKTLKVSRWQTKLGDLQARLSEALIACGRPGIGVDWKPGPKTGEAIARLRECPAFAIGGEAGLTMLTAALWERLWPGEAPPTVAQRVGALVFNFESTDYDRFLWNVGQAADPIAFGTWGPFGATLGAGGEVQTIATEIERRSPGLIAAAFADESVDLTNLPRTNWRDEYCATAQRPAPQVSGAALLLSLSAPLSAANKDALRDEFCSDAHYRLWYGAFRAMAPKPETRKAFDDHYAQQNRVIVARMAKLYADRGWTPTEIDWAFFLDRATQFTGDLAAVARELDKVEAGTSPAARRLVVSRASRPSGVDQRRLRVGRDVTYVIDGLDASALSAEELDAWARYGSIRARQAGLSDERLLAASPF